MMGTRFAFVAGIVAALLPAGPTAASPLDVSTLPRCWEVVSTYQAGGAELEGFGSRFGVELEALTNYKIDAAGIPLQVNVVACADPDDARKVHEYFMTASNATPMKYIQNGNSVCEFLCDDVGVRSKMQDLMGLYPRDVLIYRVRVEVAPLETSDDARWNELFDAALRCARDPDDTGAVADALALATRFTFSNRLVLRNEQPAWGAPSYSFSVEPVSTSAAGDALVASFAELPRVVDVPRVTLDATVPVRAFSAYVPPEPVNAYNLTRSADPWPATHREILRVFEGGWDPSWPVMEKVEYILCWVNENIECRGEVLGSRHGVIETLEQGYGRAWDRSDLVVSMCRRAEIPAREVMGWHTGRNQGHVWVQVYDAESGWVSLDATTSWVGVDAQYIPLFLLEQGHPPFVYTSMPGVGRPEKGKGR